jgi:uncharacterized protein
MEVDLKLQIFKLQIMKYLILVVVILFCVKAQTQSGEKNFIDQNYIEVTGKAEMEIVPDKIYLNIVVSEKDSKNKVSLKDMEKAMIGKLTELGIDVSKNLSIKDISSIFKRNYISKSDILLTKEYELLVYDGDIAGKVITELEKIDISNVGIERVDHSKIEQYRKDVKVNATKAAKEKAELLAGAISQIVGKALYIQELEQNLYQMPMSNRFVMQEKALGLASDSNEPVLDFEKIKLEYAVLVKFELK